MRFYSCIKPQDTPDPGLTYTRGVLHAPDGPSPISSTRFRDKPPIEPPAGLCQSIRQIHFPFASDWARPIAPSRQRQTAFPLLTDPTAQSRSSEGPLRPERSEICKLARERKAEKGLRGRPFLDLQLLPRRVSPTRERNKRIRPIRGRLRSVRIIQEPPAANTL
jgi:hypothetical protein